MASGFEIDGTTYDVPVFDSFTMDEAQVLFDYSGLAIEDFASADPDASEEERQAHEAAILQRAKNPAFKRALLHIALQRGNPELSPSKVKEMVGQANLVAVALGLAGEDDDQSPPDQEPTSTLDESSPRSSDGSSTSSGRSDSEATSDEPAVGLASTGATR